MRTTGATAPDRTPGRLFAGLWLVVAIAIALGAAGVVAWIGALPAGGTRPELTWSGDAALASDLDGATGDLRAIAGQVERLGVLGRGALAALTARDFDLLDTTIAEGAVVAVGIRDASTALRGRLEAMPGPSADRELRLSPASLDRFDRVLAAVDITNGLAEGWGRLAQGVGSAARLSTLLDGHDQLILDAIEDALARRWTESLQTIDEATAKLADAEGLRDRLENTTDVATLDEWLRRNREYDVALRHLYEVSSKSPDRVTPEMRAALDAEKEARDALPKTTRNLVIILAEIARGGLNQTVIGIEEARARLDDALGALEASPPPP
ncbi:MAG TPA: hypothetical protein VH723_07280 [Candidatus Limnocylindrales bacterium]|jgi:hypothetical protein